MQPQDQMSDTVVRSEKSSRAILGRDPKIAILIAISLVIIFLAVVPLVYLIIETFFEGGEISLAAIVRAYSSYGLGELALNTLVFTVGSTALAGVIGITLAFITERTDAPFKRLVFASAVLPLIIPGVLYVIAWILLVSPRTGLINSWLYPIFGDTDLTAFGMGGMILVQGLEAAPLVFLLMVAAFKSMDPSLEESAFLSGARFRHLVTRVTLPMVAPAIAAALLIIGIRAVEAFETPTLLGMPTGTWVLTSRIWRVLDTYPPDFGQAGAYSLTLFAITTIAIYYYSRYTKKAKSFQTVTGKGFRPRTIKLPKSARRIVTVIIMVYIFFAVALPTLVLVYVSFQPYYTAPSWESFSRLTIDNYVEVFAQPQTLRAFGNSLLLAAGSATVVMILTAITAWVVVRTRIRGRWILDNLTFLPLVIPGIVLGAALLIVYVRLPIAIYGTLWILLIAYVTRFMPYGMRYATSSMLQIGSELEESAMTSGATWFQMFRKILVPLLLPGLVAGWIYIAMVAMRELSSSILLYSPGTEVLSITIWEYWQNNKVPQLAALGIVMVVVLVGLISLAEWLGRRTGVDALQQ